MAECGPWGCFFNRKLGNPEYAQLSDFAQDCPLDSRGGGENFRTRVRSHELQRRSDMTMVSTVFGGPIIAFESPWERVMTMLRVSNGKSDERAGDPRSEAGAAYRPNGPLGADHAGASLSDFPRHGDTPDYEAVMEHVKLDRAISWLYCVAVLTGIGLIVVAIWTATHI